MTETILPQSATDTEVQRLQCELADALQVAIVRGDKLGIDSTVYQARYDALADTHIWCAKCDKRTPADVHAPVCVWCGSNPYPF